MKAYVISILKGPSSPVLLFSVINIGLLLYSFDNEAALLKVIYCLGVVVSYLVIYEVVKGYFDDKFGLISNYLRSLHYQVKEGDNSITKFKKESNRDKLIYLQILKKYNAELFEDDSIVELEDEEFVLLESELNEALHEKENLDSSGYRNYEFKKVISTSNYLNFDSVYDEDENEDFKDSPLNTAVFQITKMMLGTLFLIDTIAIILYEKTILPQGVVMIVNLMLYQLDSI